MNRTAMNKKARQMIADICEEKSLNSCELCGDTFGLAPAHRNPRRFYNNETELSDYNQFLALCIECHTRMDDRSITTEFQKEDIFNLLRG